MEFRSRHTRLVRLSTITHSRSASPPRAHTPNDRKRALLHIILLIKSNIADAARAHSSTAASGKKARAGVAPRSRASHRDPRISLSRSAHVQRRRVASMQPQPARLNSPVASCLRIPVRAPHHARPVSSTNLLIMMRRLVLGKSILLSSVAPVRQSSSAWRVLSKESLYQLNAVTRTVQSLCLCGLSLTLPLTALRPLSSAISPA